MAVEITTINGTDHISPTPINNNFNNVITQDYYLINLINLINNNTISKSDALNAIDNINKLYDFNIENNQYYIKLINI